MAHTQVSRQCSHHIVKNRVSQLTHLRVGPILDGMRDETAFCVHSERFRLGLCGFFKLLRSDRNRRCSLDLKPYRVMQTARGTGSSVGQTFYDEVVVFLNLTAQRIRRRFGKRRFRIPIYRNAF